MVFLVMIMDILIDLCNCLMIVISGVKSPSNSKAITISKFPSDANPLQTATFCVLSVHWNNKGASGCGPDKSAVYCNGKKLVTFTAGNIDGDKSFAIGSVGINGFYKMKGEWEVSRMR